MFHWEIVVEFNERGSVLAFHCLNVKESIYLAFWEKFNKLSLVQLLILYQKYRGEGLLLLPQWAISNYASTFLMVFKFLFYAADTNDFVRVAQRELILFLQRFLFCFNNLT